MFALDKKDKSLLTLLPWEKHLETYQAMLEEPLQGGRKRGHLLLLCSLILHIHPLFDPVQSGEVHLFPSVFSEQISQALLTGQKEKAYFQAVSGGFLRLADLSASRPGKLDYYRFFRDFGSYGLDSALLAIVEGETRDDKFHFTPEILQEVFYTWFEEHAQVVNPPRLVDGSQLQRELSVGPGSHIGHLLESIRSNRFWVKSTRLRKRLLMRVQNTKGMANMIAHLHDIDMFYEIRGSGRPVCLLHGLALDHSIWLEMADTYADQAQFIMPDLRGHGRTPLGNADASLEQLADDVIQLADTLGHERFILVGHSMGGYIALALAETHPERLAGLVMVTSNARSDSPEKRESRLEEARRALVEGTQSIGSTLIRRMMPEGEFAQPDEHMCEVIMNSSSQGFTNVQTAIGNVQSSACCRLLNLPCPCDCRR